MSEYTDNNNPKESDTGRQTSLKSKAISATRAYIGRAQQLGAGVVERTSTYVSQEKYPVGGLVLSRNEAVLGLLSVGMLIMVLSMMWTLSQKPWKGDPAIRQVISEQIADARTDLDTSISSLSSELKPQTEEVITRITRIESGFARFEERLVSSEDAVKDLQVASADLRVDVMDEVANLDERYHDFVDTTQAQFSAVSDRIGTLETWRTTVIRPTRIARARTQRVSSSPTLPFKPVGLEMWGGAMQLTVQHDGETKFLSEGDRLEYWQVRAIEADKIVLQDGGSREVTLGYNGDRFSNVPASLSALTVRTNPADARVRIMNILPVYHEGIALEPGPYDILVTRAGYAPFRKWVRVGEDDRVLNVSLNQRP